MRAGVLCLEVIRDMKDVIDAGRKLQQHVSQTLGVKMTSDNGKKLS